MLLFQVLGRPRSIIWLRPTTLPSCFQPKHPPSCRLSRPRYHIHVSSGRCGKSRLMQDVDVGFEAAVEEKNPKKPKTVLWQIEVNKGGRNRAPRGDTSLFRCFCLALRTRLPLCWQWVSRVRSLRETPEWLHGFEESHRSPESTQRWVENGFWVNYCFEI